ncbi:MAG TPA: helicase HerA-like domain-containing protein [Longimicrobium sp.]
MNPDVLNAARAAFPPSTGTVTLGAVVHEGACHPEPVVTLPLSMLNRHGLIAGATGTGKTKTLQLIAEQLSAAGVSVFLSDVKGDLSGIGTAGEESDRVRQRAADTGYPWQRAGMPTEFLSLSGKVGAQMRATVSSFGPLLLAKVLGINDTQSSVLTLVFEYCDDKGLLLLDLSDLRAVLTYLSGEGADELKSYGGMSKATVGVLLRELIELEAQDAERFFGEPEFDLDDLLRTDAEGWGIVSVLELQDVQDKPALFSTFMLWMLATLYHSLPEVGDVDKPKLVFFFDEAHLLFDNASKALKDQVEQVVRLIRSKGVGVFFITQNPRDVPAEILGQLGHRVQHALRAFTPDDEQALRSAARTFPKTTFYDVEETLTTLGIGEALVTTLSPNGVPTQPFATRLVPPSSRMGPLTPDELRQRLAESDQVRKYAEMVDRESAREMLEARMAEDDEQEQAARDDFPDVPRGGRTPRRPSADDDYEDRAARSGGGRGRGRPQKSTLEKVLGSPTTKQFARTLARGLVGALLGGRRRR